MARTGLPQMGPSPRLPVPEQPGLSVRGCGPHEDLGVRRVERDRHDRPADPDRTDRRGFAAADRRRARLRRSLPRPHPDLQRGRRRLHGLERDAPRHVGDRPTARARTRARARGWRRGRTHRERTGYGRRHRSQLRHRCGHGPAARGRRLRRRHRRPPRRPTGSTRGRDRRPLRPARRHRRHARWPRSARRSGRAGYWSTTPAGHAGSTRSPTPTRSNGDGCTRPTCSVCCA